MFASNAQTTIFQDDFESGTANWSLNVGGSGQNNWVINNAFTGNLFTSTPTQPGGITNSPESQYLHIYNASACTSGDCQAVFLAASGGDRTAEMANSISTTGITNVSLDFYYLCNGEVSATYGTVDYSTDDGLTWLNTGVEYAGVATWTQESISNPAWDNQANLKFRFHWIESTTGSDPSFSVDEVVVSGMGAANDITTNSPSQMAWCYGTTITDQLDFTATGTYNAGNVYTAEMSDAAGSFAAPTTIGTLASSASGSLTINISIPGSMPAGSGYRVRVVASDPATVGTDNGTDIEIYPETSVTLGTYTDVCVYTPFFPLTGGLPTGGTYSGPGVAAGSFDPAAAGTGTHTITYSYTDGNNCTYSTTETITVDDCLSLGELDNLDFKILPNPVSESFSVESITPIESVRIMDMHGRVIQSYVEGGAYDVSTLSEGVYLVQVALAGQLKTTRLVVR